MGERSFTLLGLPIYEVWPESENGRVEYDIVEEDNTFRALFDDRIFVVPGGRVGVSGKAVTADITPPSVPTGLIATPLETTPPSIPTGLTATPL